MTSEQETSFPGAVASIDPDAPIAETMEAGRLRSVYAVGRELLEESEPASVVRAIERAIVARLDPDRACILAVSAEGRYRVLASHGFSLEGPQDDWPLSRTVLRQVSESGLALLAVDASTHPQVGQARSIEQLRISSILSVPLGRKPIRGIVYLDRRAGKPAFSKDDLEFLSAIAAYASLALAKSQELERTAEALRTSDERLRMLKDDLLRHRIVGRSPRLLSAYKNVQRLAEAGARVLLRGETGTGKELFARAYALSSPRSNGPYVPVPIPSLAPTLVESELFGHVKGAFTEASKDKKGRLEVADGGVLFLDEVGDIAVDVQVKLLRFLDSGELVRVGDTAARRVDAFIVSATNRPLEKDVAEGRMRHDLLARLGHEVLLPPLRERLEDIPLLVDHYVESLSGRTRGQRLTSAAVSRLQEHDWPFNVRELQQVVERSLCLADRPIIEADDLPAYIGRSASRVMGAPPATRAPAVSSAPLPPTPSLREVVGAAERQHIVQTLERSSGNRRRAAEALGISADTLYRRLRDLGIQAEDDQAS